MPDYTAYHINLTFLISDIILSKNTQKTSFFMILFASCESSENLVL